MTISERGLARRSVGPTTLWVFGVSASAPMTVLAGGVTTTYATGVIGVPLSFLVLGAALGLAAVGFTALVRDTPPHAATFAALLTHGLGRGPGLSGAAIALLAYNAVQIGLYGLLGATVSALLGGLWWVWALVAWPLLTAGGIAHLRAGARVVAGVLAVEVAVIACVVVAALTDPAEPAASWEPIGADRLFTEGVGTVLALGIAAFVGFESVTAFGEETRDRQSTARAMTAVLVFLSLLYATASWALAVAVGPTAVADAARAEGAQLPITVLRNAFGDIVAGLAVVLVILSVLGAMTAFHHVVARYLYALGREGVLPSRLATIRDSGRAGRGGVPVSGSIVQSALALAVVSSAALIGVDPIALFQQLSTLAAIGVMVLMIAVCAATIGYYQPPAKRSSSTPLPSTWQRLHAPLLGAVAMTVVLVITVTQLGTTTGDSTGHSQWLLPAVLIGTAAVGPGWAGWLRRHHPAAWTAIGRGQPRPLAVVDRALSDLPL